MKTWKNYLLIVVFALAGTGVFAQARIQVIHNSADAAASVVDVWLDQTLLLDNFAFRTASAFMDAPAGTQFTIAIKGPDSQNPDNPLWSQTYTLTDGETYVLVADGIISSSGYDPLTPFDIEVFAGAREIANQAVLTDMLVHHGSTDAPVIDIFEIGIGLGQIVDDLAYAEFDGYHELPSKNYIFEIRQSDGSTVIEQYSVPFEELGLRGEAVTVLASGFMDPQNNSNGPEFGLWLAVAGGGALIELEPYNPTANVQIINNSADAAMEVFDVWMDQTLLVDDLAFRTATPFLNVPGDQSFMIYICAPDSQNPDDPIFSQNFSFGTDLSFILVFEGIVSPSGYDPDIPFGYTVALWARETANQPNKTDLILHNGSTDAGAVDFYETAVGLGLLADDISFWNFSEYLEMEPLDYILNVTDESGNELYGRYEAYFETMGLEGFAVTVLSSGFLNPESNSDGPAFGLWMATATGGNLIELTPYNPTARVQLIHNSADAAASVVDIWLDDELLLDNFAFQTASPFVDLPAEREITIAVKDSDSQGPENPLWSETYTLLNDSRYIMVAEGIVSTSGYDPLIPFDVAVYPQAREIANQQSQTDMIFHHASTDAPAIDIIEVGIGVGQIVNNLDYSQFTGYLGMAAVNYIFQVKDENGLMKLGSYEAPLAEMGLQGDAVTVVISGFLYPENNSNGPEFGLFMAQAAGGPLVRLQEYAPKARVQIIHNSADTAAEVVDVWLDQDLILDNFAYHTASAFIDVPADEQITIYVKGPDSQDPYNPLWFHNYTLTEGKTYIFVADGIISNSGYNPAIPFDMAFYDEGREEAAISGRTDILVHHGSTDAPMVDILEVGLGAGLIVDNLVYAQFDGYLELPTIDYLLEVREQSNNLLGTFRANIESLGLQNAAITVVASGFVNPSVNNDGPGFGLWVALATGGPLVELIEYIPIARVQVVHNSGDAILSEIDVWMNETLLLDDFAYRTATPFVDMPANNQFTLAIKPANSQNPENPLWSGNYTLTEDETYLLVADGIISPEGYDPAEPFALFVYDGALETASQGSNTDVLVFHGVTDAPTVDIAESTAGTLVDDLSYGEFDGYLALPTANYSLEVLDETGSTVIGTFAAPLDDLDLDGQTLTVLASGFIDPTVNNDGPAFGLLAVLADGTTLMLMANSGVGDISIDLSSLNIYPNPASTRVQVSFEMKVTERLSVEIKDLSGKTVKSVEPGIVNAGAFTQEFDIHTLPSGIYFLNVRMAGGVVCKKFIKL
jgi:hypothetical protein